MPPQICSSPLLLNEIHYTRTVLSEQNKYARFPLCRYPFRSGYDRYSPLANLPLSVIPFDQAHRLLAISTITAFVQQALLLVTATIIPFVQQALLLVTTTIFPFNQLALLLSHHDHYP